MDKKDCLYCGEPYEPKNSQQLYCSKLCGRRYVYHNHTYTYVCKGCGIEYEAKEKNRSQYHSRECAYEHQREWHGNIGVVCVVCGIEYVGADGYSNEYCSQVCRDKAYTTTCESCGVEFVAHVANQKRCYGTECERSWKRKMHKEKYTPLSEINPYVIKVCDHCGKEYEVNVNASSRVYCGVVCANRAAKLSARHRGRSRVYQRRRRRRAHTPGGEGRVYRAKIFKRDRWTCRLCGEPVFPELKYPHPMSATIDHIIPLARGGRHVPANCQLTHMICNSRKRDLLPGEADEMFADD